MVAFMVSSQSQAREREARKLLRGSERRSLGAGALREGGPHLRELAQRGSSVSPEPPGSRPPPRPGAGKVQTALGAQPRSARPSGPARPRRGGTASVRIRSARRDKPPSLQGARRGVGGRLGASEVRLPKLSFLLQAPIKNPKTRGGKERGSCQCSAGPGHRGFAPLRSCAVGCPGRNGVSPGDSRIEGG